jgi:3-dehydroquinate synthase
MGNKKIQVELPGNQYDILIERGLLQRAGEEIAKKYKGKNIFLITDDIVGPLYEAEVRKSAESCGFKVETMTIPAGESSKSYDMLLDVYSFLTEKGASRKDLLVALGGGVTGDLAGFAAATWMRGMPFAQIPTSLLAQIDSSIGGKVAINLPKGKNLVGAFYHPIVVLIDPECLKTLDKRYLSDGAAEAVKYGCIRDPKVFGIFQEIERPEELYQHLDEIIYRCCCIKRDVVQKDEKEQGERMILNFGHTLGHAVESYYDYKKYTHGEAVAVGMAYIADISERYGFAQAGTAERIRSVLKTLHLPVEIDSGIREALIDGVFADKKNNSVDSNLILIREVGKVFIKTVKTAELRSFLREGGF